MAAHFKLILVWILSATLLGCNSAAVSSRLAASQASAPRPGFTLLSWQDSDGRARYILMSHNAADSFLEGFDQSRTPLENAKRFGHRVESFATLKDRLLTLPPNATILWQDFLELGLKHSPLQEMNQLCSFAEVHHLHFYGCY